jgi:hypothetical protein
VDDARRERAKRRQSWPIRVAALDASAGAEVPGDAGARVAAVWRISLDASLLSGRSLPDYTRAEMPGRVIRSDEH